MKKISLLLISSLLATIAFGIPLYGADQAPSMVSHIGYPLYEYNVTQFCGEFKNSQNNSEFVYLTDPSSVYKNLDEETSTNTDFIGEAKKLYRKNMDGIYGCATSIINIKALERVKKELGAYSNQLLMAKVAPKIEERIVQAQKELAESENRCKINSAKDENIIKKAILDQSTYEYCRYLFYLQYLREYTGSRYGLLQYNYTGSLNAINDIFASSIDSLVQTAIENSNSVAKEISDTEKAFPIAFKAYSEYENNIVVHVLLELLRDDYIVYREELHKTLNPINQVVYKLSNAMRK